MCVQNRLHNIKRQYPNQYNLVIANIILAKKILKAASAYKPNRGDTPQGSLGVIEMKKALKEYLMSLELTN